METNQLPEKTEICTRKHLHIIKIADNIYTETESYSGVKMVSDTIPRLQRLSYLLVGLHAVAGNQTFDQVRKSILGEAQRQDETLWAPTGYASVYRSRDEYSMWTNARDALGELMRLGLIEKRSLPRKRNLVDAHRGIKYTLTDDGKAIAQQMGPGPQLADTLFQRLYSTHPYLRQFLSVLTNQDVLIPEFNLKTMGYAEGETAKILSQVATEVVARIAEAKLTCPDAGDFESRLRNHLKEKIATKGKEISVLHLVDYVNSGIQAVLLPHYGMTIDHLSFDHLVSWGEELFFCNSSRHVPHIRGRIIYLTSELPTGPNGQVSLKRHGRSQLEAKIIEVTEQQFNSLKGSSPFAPIHAVRAAVCYQLKINDRLFDDVLRDIYLSRINFSKHLNLDGGLPRELPPGIKPLTINKRRCFIMSIFDKEQ